ncbi:MAG: hypothetical protein WCO26_00395 [Deltaproteobacteria bacterium]
MKRDLIPVKLSFLCISLLFIVCVSPACDRPKQTGADFDKIDTSGDPEQGPVSASEPAVVTVNSGSFTLTPKAKYKLSGKVVSRKSYSDGWESTVSALDLAIVWGKLAEPHYDKYISYSQSGRWYFFKTKTECPLEPTYVTTHSANNHIVPVNENVGRAVKSIRKRDRVVLEGYLVNIQGSYKGRDVAWNTSLSPTDTGNGSCELFYVTKVRIESKVYE